MLGVVVSTTHPFSPYPQTPAPRCYRTTPREPPQTLPPAHSAPRLTAPAPPQRSRRFRVRPPGRYRTVLPAAPPGACAVLAPAARQEGGARSGPLRMRVRGTGACAVRRGVWAPAEGLTAGTGGAAGAGVCPEPAARPALPSLGQAGPRHSGAAAIPTPPSLLAAEGGVLGAGCGGGGAARRRVCQGGVGLPGPAGAFCPPASGCGCCGVEGEVRRRVTGPPWGSLGGDRLGAPAAAEGEVAFHPLQGAECSFLPIRLCVYHT